MIELDTETGTYYVPSKTTKNTWHVFFYTAKNIWICDCPHITFEHKKICRHIRLVKFYTKHNPKMIKVLTNIPVN
jgi:hypothetical protein